MLHVGGHGNTHTCVPKGNTLANNISSAAFADDLLCPTGDLHRISLKVQACKLTLYSNWAGLFLAAKPRSQVA